MGVDLVTLSTRSKSAKSAYEFINIFKDNLTESEMIRILRFTIPYHTIPIAYLQCIYSIN